MNKKHISVLLKMIALLILTGAILVLLFAFRKPRAQQEDFQNMLTREYNTVFLSMYPVTTYRDENFPYFFGTTPFKATYCIPKLSVIEQYMKQIIKSEKPVATVYLGIRPDKIKIEKLQAMISRYPSMAFEIILSYPSADYWRSLSEQEYKKVLEDYSHFLLTASSIPNTHLFFQGSQKWLINNPDNYETEWLVNEEIATTILLTSTIYGEYYVTPDNAALYAQSLENLTREVRDAPENFPDFTGRRLVFFGDSVIGNYTDTSSIPGVVSGLTGASAYNCGYGGNSASTNEDSAVNLSGIAQAFADGNLSALPEDSQLYRGMASYLSEGPSEQKPCFILNYGLNDYFGGYPVSSEENPYDPTTFCGAIRTAVTTLRSRFQDAQIILCTPSYCVAFQNGAEPRGVNGNVLEEYVDAVLSLSQELQVDVLDIYRCFGIDSSNWTTYLLPDQVHPNAAYRYLIGSQISRLIR